MDKSQFKDAVEIDGVRYTSSVIDEMEKLTGKQAVHLLEGSLSNVSRKKAIKLTSQGDVIQFEKYSRKAAYFKLNSLIFFRDGNTISQCFSTN